MLGKAQKYVGETMPIESSEKEYSPCRMQSTMETASCPVADAIRDETYLQFPVAEKYRIIGHLRNFILIIIPQPRAEIKTGVLRNQSRTDKKGPAFR